jgi:hypothetical protein
MYGNAEQSVVDSYNLVASVTGGTTTSAPTTFPFGITSGDIDLLLPRYGGRGNETQAYRLAILITAKPAGTGTIVVTGAASGGLEELIASLAIDCSADITETGDWVVVDTITLTSYHLAACSIVVADSGNDHPCKVGFDAIGYRYIKFYVTSLTTITDVRIYARYF